MKNRWATLLIAAGVAGFAARAWANPAYSMTNESGSVMYTDLGNGLDATYLVFQFTKNSPGSDATVWAQLDTSASSIISNVGTGQHLISAWNPSTGAHGTAPTADGDGFDQGETKGVFFLVKASATTNTGQSLTVNLFSTCSDTSAPGCANGTLSGSLGSFAVQFTVQDTIKANANKVNTVITIPNNPQIGQFGKITVTGCTGTVGAAKVLYFSPVSAHTWPADAFEFIDSDISIDNYAGSPYRDVALIPNGDVLTTNNCYDEIFTFVINAVGTASTTPANFISSGTQIKHTTNSSGSFTVTIPPPGCPTITVTSNPATLPDAEAGPPGYGVLFSASPAGTYTFSASGLPGWLTLNPTTGALIGTPSASDVGSVSFTITATNTGGEPAGCTGQAQFGFNVICPSLTITSTPAVLPDALSGQPYSATFDETPAVPLHLYTFSALNLPGWLNLTSSGALSGTPSNSDVGPVSFTVIVTDNPSGCTTPRLVSFNVNSSTPIAQIPTLGGAGLVLLALTLAGAAFLMIRRG